MALIQCSRCGYTVSDRAATCPHCGNPVRRTDLQNGRSIQTRHADGPRPAPPQPPSSPQKQGNRGVMIALLSVLGVLLIVVGVIVFLVLADNQKSVETVENEVMESTYEEVIDYVADSYVKDYTDLGLSVLWSDYNVGASNCYEFGNLYGWGSTNTYLTTNLNNYPTSNPPHSLIGTEYDVAHNLWGGRWRMPSLAELKELQNRCQWRLVEYNYDKYYEVTGPNGNSILLPITGYKRGDEHKMTDSGFIWSAELYEGSDEMAANLGFNTKGNIGTSGYYRFGGQSIRPVMDK